MKALNLYGQRFGYLEVIGQTDYFKDNSGGNRRKWICKCDCGNVVFVLGSSLNTGKTKSCGCEKYGKNNITHNKSKTRLYRIWTDLKTRCNNPKFPSFKNYGGRGIKVCEDWESDFMRFYEWAMSNGYDETLSIDRIDNNRGYFPSNCRWVTNYVQSRNKRTNKKLTFNGITLTQLDWSLKLGGSKTLVPNRLKSGWTIERALTTPPMKGKYKNGKAIKTIDKGTEKHIGSPSVESG